MILGLAAIADLVSGQQASAVCAQVSPPAAQVPVASQATEPAGPAPADAAAEAKARLRLGADYQLASWLIAQQQADGKLAAAALQRLADGDAKEFAAAARDEHEKLLRVLRPFADLEDTAKNTTDKLLVEPAAAQAATTPAATPVNTDPQQATVDVAASNPAVPVVPVPAVSVASAESGGDGRTGTVIIAKMEGAGFDLVSLKRNLAEREAATGAAWVTEASGDEAARRYLLLETASQRDTLDALTVFRAHASPKLQAALDEIRPRVEARLKAGHKLLR